MGIYACPRCGNPNGWWSGNMRDFHDCPNPRPKPEPVEFTPDEAKAGRAMRGNTLHYCCYGMYCDAGHDSDCPVAHGVSVGLADQQEGGADAS